MPGSPIQIESLTLTGFRAYLELKQFDFSKKRNLAVFAPNGSGKSGFVDGFEFILSPDGTIARLGVRAIHNKAGVVALAHNLAEEKGVTSEVRIVLKQGKTTHDGSRLTSGSRSRPPAADALAASLHVDPIVRGYELRRFVEVQTPEERYAEVGQWLQLTPLVEVQRNLRSLRQLVKSDLEDIAPKKAIDARLSKATARTITEWDESAVLTYANSILSPLDPKLQLSKLREDDPHFSALLMRAQDEEQQIGIAALKQIKVAIEVVYSEPSGSAGATGAIAEFESALQKRAAAEASEQAERGKAANAVFAKVWDAAEPLFAEGAAEFEVCPVCDTPISATARGTREGIREHIRLHRAQLASYAASRQALEDAQRALSGVQKGLAAKLSVLVPLIPDSEAKLRSGLTTYANAVEQWTAGDAPDASAIKPLLVALLAATVGKINEIEQRQGEHTYARAKSRLESLLEIKADDEMRARAAEELGKIQTSLNEQATFISSEIRNKIQTLLDMIREPTNRLFKSIQGKDATLVRLELPAEDDTNQQRLSLLVDFAENRMGVSPSGYLSDSQVHSLALSLRLAAIAAFNAEAPFAVLDDIVTSYDADHRRTIASMLAEEVPKLQIFVTTHDQRFFSYMKDQLPAAGWAFTQITRLDRDYGPRFADHKVTDEVIEARWTDGKSAANEMRQAEEEWLLECCRSFGVDIRIRDVHRAYSYERSELAMALAAFLKHTGLTPPDVPGVKNKFLLSLQKGEIENFGSHFQDVPYGDGSIGDEKARWAEFVFFRNHFVCAVCNRSKFKRPLGLKKPVCAHDKCETPFQFSATSAAGHVAGAATK